VSAGGVADSDDSAKVELVLRSDLTQMIGAGRNVLEGAGPTAAVVADAPIFEIPGGEAVSGEIGGNGAHEIQSDGAVIEFSEFGNPAAAVNNDDDGMRPPAGRDAQFAELQRDAAVSDAVGVGDGTSYPTRLQSEPTCMTAAHSPEVRVLGLPSPQRIYWRYLRTRG
jgi:hypothetical protein